MVMKTRCESIWNFIIPLLLVLFLSSCTGTPEKPEKEVAAFQYDEAYFEGVKPWSSENFKPDPDNFTFAILGDRGGGANPKGTYERAIGQLNLLQPEFVMSVGDYVEGY